MRDLKVIKALEQELGVKLPEKGDHGLKKGYTLNKDGRISGLSLNDCQVQDLNRVMPYLNALDPLVTLDLSGNQISDYSFLKEIKQLRSLDLSRNRISDISFLTTLNPLQTLDLSHNKIKDYSFLDRIEQLQTLRLIDNKISDLTFLKDLTQLTSLNLSLNPIQDISEISHLNKLETLWLYDVQISNITVIRKMHHLKRLQLANNSIRDLSPIRHLHKLELLSISGNKITEIPTWLLNKGLPFKYEQVKEAGFITLADNPITTPPLEIVKQGDEAIRNYFKSLEGNQTVRLNEIKVLLVGEGMAGKTSLLKQFQGMDFEMDESQTHGINVVTVPAQQINGFNETTLRDHHIHFWDFGGQEIMHASHQFFMSKRSIYILILDSRTDSKKYHWLKHIEKFGGDSPVIVVMNKIDANPGYNLQQKKLNESFPQISNRFIRLSCQTHEGYPELIQCLEKTIPETSMFGTEISVDWMDIKEELVQATQANRYINRTAFEKICETHGVTDESSQQTLLQYLNDLGVVLYFRQLNLANIYVLDPHWVTIGAYKIINSEKVKEGILCEDDLEFILNQEQIKEKEYDPAKEKQISYSPEEQRYILSIMVQFELCYEYDKQQGFYIVPDLLPKELPNENELNEGTLLRFVMTYDYLPATILPRLMLRLKSDIVEGQQWKYGMVLDSVAFGCQAKVKEDESAKRIDIIVQGDALKKQKYFSAIRHSIHQINQEFDNLEVKEWIPLPVEPEKLVGYQSLLGHEKAGKAEYFDGDLGLSFSVAELLDSVIDQQDRYQEMGEKFNIKFENIGNPQFSDIGNPQQHVEQKVEQQQEVRQEQTVSQEVRQEVKNVQGLFKNLKDDILDEVDLEIENDKEKKRIQNDLKKAESAFAELEKAASEDQQELPESTKGRIEEFVDNLSDENSRINKALKLVPKGVNKLRKMGKLYNNVAPFFMLPSIPEVLLGGKD